MNRCIEKIALKPTVGPELFSRGKKVIQLALFCFCMILNQQASAQVWPSNLDAAIPGLVALQNRMPGLPPPDAFCPGNQNPAPFNYRQLMRAGTHEIRYYINNPQVSNYTFTLDGGSYEYDMNELVQNALDGWTQAMNDAGALGVTFLRTEVAAEATLTITYNVPFHTLPGEEDTAAVGSPPGYDGFDNTADGHNAAIEISRAEQFNDDLQDSLDEAREMGVWDGYADDFAFGYLRYTLLHEIGHAVFGLDHASYPGDVFGSEEIEVIPAATRSIPDQPTVEPEVMDVGITRQAVTSETPDFVIYLKRYKDRNLWALSNTKKIRPSEREIKAALGQLNNNRSQLLYQATYQAKSPCPTPSGRVDAESKTTYNVAFDSPTWLDINGNGSRDYCNASGQLLTCYLLNEDGSMTQVLNYNLNDKKDDGRWGIADPGWDTTRIFIPAGYSEGKTKNQRFTAFCRLVGTSTHQLCEYFYWDEQTRQLIYHSHTDSGYLDGGWTDRTVLGDSAMVSTTRWYMDLEGKGIYSFCRLIDKVRLACKINKGTDGFGDEIYSPILSDINNAKIPGMNWIKYGGSVALCWPSADQKYVTCLPYNREKKSFSDLPGYLITTYGESIIPNSSQFVFNYLGTNQGAYCYAQYWNKAYGSFYWACKSFTLTDTPIVTYGTRSFADDVSASSYNYYIASYGFATLPGALYPGPCGIDPKPIVPGNLSSKYDFEINCAVLYDASVTNSNQKKIASVIGGNVRVTGSLPTPSAGTAAWINYRNNTLYCRRENYNMVCTRIYFGINNTSGVASNPDPLPTGWDLYCTDPSSLSYSFYCYHD